MATIVSLQTEAFRNFISARIKKKAKGDVPNVVHVDVPKVVHYDVREKGHLNGSHIKEMALRPISEKKEMKVKRQRSRIGGLLPVRKQDVTVSTVLHLLS